MTKLSSNICAHLKSGTTFALLVKVAEGGMDDFF
jgi:hypothetical protein